MVIQTTIAPSNARSYNINPEVLGSRNRTLPKNYSLYFCLLVKHFIVSSLVLPTTFQKRFITSVFLYSIVVYMLYTFSVSGALYRVLNILLTGLTDKSDHISSISCICWKLWAITYNGRLVKLISIRLSIIFRQSFLYLYNFYFERKLLLILLLLSNLFTCNDLFYLSFLK